MRKSCILIADLQTLIEGQYDKSLDAQLLVRNKEKPLSLLVLRGQGLFFQMGYS